MDGLSSLAKIFTGGGGGGGLTPPFAGGSIPGVSSGTDPLWQKLLLGGLFAGGEVGNLLESQKRSALQNKQAQYLNYVTNLVKDPAAISRMATSEAAPLSQSLVQSVNNQVQGDMAARGLAQAPGIFAASQSQALAPFVQQNQNTALEAVLRQLGIPISAGSTMQFSAPGNMTNLLSQFLKSTQARPIGAAPVAPGITLPTSGSNQSGITAGDDWWNTNPSGIGS